VFITYSESSTIFSEQTHFLPDMA